MLKRGLVCAIIVLFVGMSSMSLAGSISMEKQAIQESLPFAYPTSGTSGISLITVKVTCEMGLNDWYVSGLGVTFSKESDDISEIKYLIDGGPVQDYTEPFYLTGDGEDRSLEWYAVDNEGGQSEVDGPFIFNMDQTKPIIDLTYEWENGPEPDTWLITVTATAWDTMSGMSHVKFYINNELGDTVYGSGPTYIYQFLYDGTYKWTPKAVAFDNAGNSIYDEIIDPPGSINALESSIVKSGFNEEKNIQNSINDDSSDIIEPISDKFTKKSHSGNGNMDVFDPAYIIVVFDRKTGKNDWIISNVSIPIFYESDRIAEVYYKIDDGEWIFYNEPLVISDEGTHSFSWYAVDSEGYASTPDSMSFKIDQTCPEINLIRERIAFNSVKFIANVYDETSGINRVHFNSGYGGKYTDYDFPYEWVWTPDQWIGWFYEHDVDVTVYDNAGHKKHSSMNVRDSYSYNQQSSSSFLFNFLEQFPLLERVSNLI
jgi:hypothetical protein